MPTFKFYEAANMTQSGTTEYSIFPTLYDGDSVSQSWNYVEIKSSQFVGEYRGNFEYSWNRLNPAAGTLTGLDHYRIISSMLSTRVSSVSNAAYDVEMFFSIGAQQGAHEAILFMFSGNDVIEGSTYSDIVFAYEGNDTVSGSLGNDNLDGGSGLDIALFHSNRKNYAITKISDSKFTVNNTNNFDGIDTLTNFERVEFDDRNVALDISGTAGQAYRIYRAAFDRDPMIDDTAGLGYWIAQMDSGMSLFKVAARFIDSTEFRALYGAAPTNGEFLTKVYNNVLDRDPDAGGYAWWMDQLANNPEKTWQKVLADFSESSENQANVASLIGNGITYDAWTG